jgi:hypothetical protein
VNSETWEEPTEITSSITSYLTQQLHERVSASITEQVLTIVFQPLSIFRVRPGTLLFFTYFYRVVTLVLSMTTHPISL